jgi:pimeloyl-ACP methyl ester carboxylesterase
MKNLILIHGALGAGIEFKEVIPLLSKQYNIHIHELPGHGSRSSEWINFSLKECIRDLEKKVEEIGPTFIFGFSLGGYVALSLAQKNERNILGLITLGTKFNWSSAEAEKETSILTEDQLAKKASSFFKHLKTIHSTNLPRLLDATKRLMNELGLRPEITPKSVENVSVPVRICRGGKDKMVSKEESVQIQKALPNSHYFEIPSFIHPIGFLNSKSIARFIEVQLKSFDYQWIKTKNYGKISYKSIDNNNPNQPVLLFIHEALGSIAQWKDFPEKLCEQVSLNGFIIELEGYGFSSSFEGKRTASYLHESGTAQIPEIIQALGITQPIIIIGHSDGGTNALFLAKHIPNQIKGIITMAAHCINEKETREGIYPAIEAYKNKKLNSLELYHGAKTEKLFYDWANTWLSEAFLEWNILADIDGIEVPGFIMQGYEDQYGTEKQVELIAERFVAPVTTEIIPNCGHSPHIEQQIIVLEHIEKWIKQLT